MADENADVAQEVEDKIDTPGGSQKNPFLALVMLLNVAVMGAVAYFQYTSFQKTANQPDIRDVVKAEMKDIAESENEVEGAKPIAESDGELMQLDPFTANLAQGDGPKRFIRLNAVLKFSADSNQEEFKARRAQIRDTVISVLNSKRPEDLLKVEGKNFLKQELKASINSFFVDGKVTDIFYTSFQIN